MLTNALKCDIICYLILSKGVLGYFNIDGDSMKESTFKNIDAIVHQSYITNPITKTTRKIDRIDVIESLRIFAVNFFCMLAGFIPIMTIPLWNTFSKGSNFILEFLSCPDIIFVGVALWIAYIGSTISNRTELGKTYMLANEVGVLVGVVVFVVEVIAKEQGFFQNSIIFVICFNVMFCTAQFIIHTTSSINTKFKERRGTQ